MSPTADGAPSETIQQRHELLFQRNVAGVFRSTLDGRILECNRAMARIYGCDSPEELKRYSAEKFYDSDEDREAFLRRLREEGSLTNYEHRQRRVDGTPVWLLENCTLERDPETGEESIVGTMIDITERKRARERLEAAEERYRRLFEHNVAGVFQVSLDGRILDCNPAFARMFGYDSPDELKKVPARSLYADPESRENYRERLLAEEELANHELRLRRRDGGVIWGLENSHLSEDPATGERMVVGTLVDITERKQLEAELERRAYHDPLTGLPNRRLLRERGEQALEMAQRHDRQVGLLFLDLKRFKLVNDTFGHGAGDRVLVEVAKRIQSLLRSADTAARVGGDEFVALLSEVRGEDGAVKAAKRLREIFRQPFRIGEESVHLDARIGLALHPDHAGSVDDLLTRADRAILYGELIKEGVSIYSPASDARPEAELTVAEELRRALEEEMLELHYQPVCRSSTGELVGAEALVRWIGPDGGVRKASQFIPTAERSGLIGQLDRWTLQTAVRQLTEWSGEDDPDWVAVNLSARTFTDPDLVPCVRRLLDEADCSRDRLVVEMTERTAMRDPGRTVETVEKLRDLGVRVAIDDFGTGYSALAHLKQYPADLMKIDMIFVRNVHRDVRNGELVRAIVELGHALGSEVVAEGVEDREEYEWLSESQCDYLQGYYLGKPVPPEELTAKSV